MASSILRWIFGNSPKFSLLRGLMDPVNNSPKFSLLRGLMDPAKNLPKLSLLRGLMEASQPKTCSPWLMIPPTFEGNNNKIMVFNFYSFEEKTVKKFFCERVGILASNDIKFVSSSHGWLALFDRGNCDLVLFNPVSGRQMKLPPFDTSDIDKVITSCSPEEEDCRVVMTFGPHLRLAFCSPSSSSADWTPIGHLHYKDDSGDNPLILRRNSCEAEGENHPIFNGRHHKAKGKDKPILRGYHDFVYSGRENIFYSIDTHMGFEYWDLEDTWYPKTRELDPNSLDLDTYPWPIRPREAFELPTNFKSLSFLVVEEGSRDILWVIRHIMPHMDAEGSYASTLRFKFPHKYPYKTIGFDVHKYDREKDALVYMDGSLDGLSLFIGKNHSFAISATKFPELKPNSIYFTDVNKLIPEEGLFGGHDLGIFNYGNKTFSSTCYYPCDRQNIKRIMPSPMWFTPNY